MSNQKSRDWDRYIKNIRSSVDDVWLIARWFSNKGYSVRIPPTTYASKPEERLKHVDQGDLYVTIKGKEERIEVKALTKCFTCKDDWWHKTEVVICSIQSFDYADPKPLVYIMLNQARTHAIFVKSESKQHWFVKRLTDKRYEHMVQDFYVSPVDHVTFSAIEL